MSEQSRQPVKPLQWVNRFCDSLTADETRITPPFFYARRSLDSDVQHLRNRTLVAFTLLKPDGEHFLQHLLQNRVDLLSRYITPLTRTREVSCPCRKLHARFWAFKVTQEWFPRVLSPTVAVKANQCTTSCKVGTCRWSPCTSWTRHQQMELHWWGWSKGLQMEDVANVLPWGHSIWPLLQLHFSASLQSSPVLFLCHPAATQMAPLLTWAATLTHTRTGTCEAEKWLSLFQEIIDRRKKKLCRHSWALLSSCIYVNNGLNSGWHISARELFSGKEDGGKEESNQISWFYVDSADVWRPTSLTQNWLKTGISGNVWETFLSSFQAFG